MTSEYRTQLHRCVRTMAELSDGVKFTSFRDGGITEIGNPGEVDVRAASGHDTLDVTGIYNKANEKGRRIATRRREHITTIAGPAVLDEPDSPEASEG